MSTAAKNHKKTKKLYSEGSKSFKVIDVDINTKKFVTSASYDEQCMYLSSTIFTLYERTAQK